MIHPMVDIKEIFIQGMEEIMLFYLHFGIVILAARISEKLQGKIKLVWVISITVLTFIWMEFSNIKAEFMISVMFSLLLTVGLYLTKMFPFDRYDYLLLFAAFLFPNRLFNSSQTFFGYSLLFIIILSILFGYGKIRTKSLRGKMFCYYTAFIYLSLIAFIFQITSDYIYDIFRQRFNSAPLALIVMVCGVVLILGLMTHFLQIKLEKPLKNLDTIGIRYLNTERHVMYLSCFTAVAFLFLHIPFVLTRTSSDGLRITLFIFCIVILLIQILFITLIYKMTYYKESLAFMKAEIKNTTDYYTALDNNLNAMANIRHDIKNVFLTMGIFVEKSKDQDMKNFFWKKIYPFAAEELEKNYLFSQLYQIPSEPLRAFMHLKLSQAYNMKETISLEIKLSENDFKPEIDIIDLTRILGILLDNAIDECLNIQEGYIEIKIRSNQLMTSFIIKNTISNDKKKEGIQKNKSTKEGHGGIGLNIVDMVIKEYTSVTLNSFIDNDIFIQSLNITNGRFHGRSIQTVDSCCQGKAE